MRALRGQRSTCPRSRVYFPVLKPLRDKQEKRAPRERGFFLQLIIEEAPQLPASARMLQFPQCLRLDLADALAGDRELLADLLQRVVGVHADAEAHAQHAL